MSEKGPVIVVVGRFAPLVCGGLTDALAGDRRVDIIASDLKDATLEQRVARQPPQVVIVSDAVEYAALARLKAGLPAIGVVVLAQNPPRGYGTVLLEVGATCLPGNVSRTELLDAILLTAQGDRLFVSADGQRIQRPSRKRASSLTRRESEVFEALSRGSSDAAIAQQLKISIATARSHVRAVLRKLNVRSRRWLEGVPNPSGPISAAS
jgi:DNA-binding NarL/FixJ family response regulator